MITANTSVIIRQDGTTSYYKKDDELEQEIIWPVNIVNANMSPTENIMVTFITNFTFRGPNETFIIDSSFITMDGQDNTFTISPSNSAYIYWNGLISTLKLNLKSITVTKFKLYVAVEFYSLNAGFLTGVSFCNHSVGNIIISECRSDSSGGNIHINENCGGLIGGSAFKSSTGTIEVSDCINTVKMSSSSSESGDNSGGIFGPNAFNDATGIINISNCSNTGNMSNNGCGGLFGSESFKNSGATLNVVGFTNSGDMTATSQKCGGLFGPDSFFAYTGTATISYCINNGSIESAYSSGAIGPNPLSNPGEIVSGTIIVENFINNGAISGSNCASICSFVGQNSTTGGTFTISNCVNNGEISGSNCSSFIWTLYAPTCSIKNSYSDGAITGTNSQCLIESSTTNTNITIDNCYIRYGKFTNISITPNKSYAAIGLWDTSDAKLLLNIDGTWVYNKNTDDSSNKDVAFLLNSLNSGYEVVTLVPTLTLSGTPEAGGVLVGAEITLTTSSPSAGTISYNSPANVTITNPSEPSIQEGSTEYTTTATAKVNDIGDFTITATITQNGEYDTTNASIAYTAYIVVPTLTLSGTPVEGGVLVGAEITLTTSSPSAGTISYNSPANVSISIPLDSTQEGSTEYTTTATATVNAVGDFTITATITQNGEYDTTNASLEYTASINHTLLSFEADEYEVYVGKTQSISAISNRDGIIQYTSSNIDTATVTINTGEVYGVSEGTTDITATQSGTDMYDSGTATYTLKVNLNPTTITFYFHPSSILVGDSFTVSASSNSTDTILFESLQPDYASIDVNVVTGIKAGKATILASQKKTSTYEAGYAQFDLEIQYIQLKYRYDGSMAVVTGINLSAQNIQIPSITTVGDTNYTVVGIDPNAFNKPEKVSGTIVFPNTLTFIGSSAFQDCALTGALNLHSIETIGASAFRGCPLSGMLILPPNLKVLEEYVFAKCSFTSMAPPTQLTHIGARAFYNLPLFIYDFTLCESLSFIDPSAFDEYNQSFLDINVYVTQYTYDRLQFSLFPHYVKFHTGVPVSNICFIAGTRVQTDQGIFPIETLTRKHTLNGQPITLTKTKHDDPYLVKIQAYAFTNTPTQDTYMSMNHRVYFNHDRVKARDLVNGNTVSLVDYHGEPLYNVLIKAHTSMLVHGMRVETLDPTSPIALVYTSRLPPLQRVKIIQKLNTQENYEETVMYLKRIQ